MKFPTAPAPARDRVLASTVADRAGFLLLRPLRSDEREHAWLIRCRTTHAEAELVIGRQPTSSVRSARQQRFTNEGVRLREESRLAGSGILAGQFDYVDSPRYGQLWLLEHRLYTPVAAWVAAAHLRRGVPAQGLVSSSSAGAALLIDLIRGAATLCMAGMCLGRPLLRELGVTAAGRLLVVSSRGIHRVQLVPGSAASATDILDRPCCRTGVHPETVLDLANEVLSSGNRRDRLVQELVRIADAQGHEHRSEALALAIVDSIQPMRGRSPTAHELVAHQRPLQAIATSEPSNGRFAALYRSARRRSSESSIGRTVGWLRRAATDRTVLRRSIVGLGLGLILAALLSVLMPGSGIG
ncbi:hypothetical protein [Lysinibacter cavernae]|uniref:Uncharacterized protein n=1 Tax=Lysinibacter cavernae TaxID=1640652 RepID=A0A7X5TS77_9MICO|nr:hypothetical protein [Lysinibacter cavernae]NIH52645.1 hypothetical protein [Lysinibacter cavernae]